MNPLDVHVPPEYEQGRPRELNDGSPVWGVKPSVVVFIAAGALAPVGVV